LHLLLDVWAVLDVLLEVADVAVHGVPGFEGEGDEGDEAKGEPFPVGRGLAQRAMGLGGVKAWEEVGGSEKAVGAHQFLTTLPVKLPQFWHWTVMFS